MADPEALLGQRLEGNVKSWKADWGWVSCSELVGDLFAHKEDLISGVPVPGVAVSFEVGKDQKSGRPRAKQIEAYSEAGASLPSSPASASAGKKKAKAPNQSMGGERVEGVVKSWKEPWGWITYPGEEKDIFAHREDVLSEDPYLPVDPGTTVVFEIGSDGKSGRRRALQIQLPPSGDRHLGIIASWKDLWGWITCPDFPEGDIFAHKEDMGDGIRIQAGSELTFEIGFDEKGRRRARRIGGVAVTAPPDVGRAPPGTITRAAPGTVARAAPGTAARAAAGGGGGKGPCYGGKGPYYGGKDASWDGKGAYYGKGYAAGYDDPYGYDPYGKGYGKGYGPYGYDPYGYDDPYGKGYGPYAGGPKGGFDGGYGPPMTAKGCKGGAAPMKGGGKGGAAGPDQYMGRRLDGLVSSWKDQWGWISSPLFASDIFAHAEDLLNPGPMPAVGSHVVFTVGLDNKKRVRAKSIHHGGGADPGAGGAPGAKPAAAAKNGAKKRQKPGADVAASKEGFAALDGQAIEGSVASWKKDWGWIHVDGYPGDLFAHKEDVDTGDELTVGQVVEFVVGKDTKTGRWRAREIVTTTGEASLLSV